MAELPAHLETLRTRASYTFDGRLETLDREGRTDSVKDMKARVTAEGSSLRLVVLSYTEDGKDKTDDARKKASEKAGTENAVIQYDVAAPDGVHTFQLKVAAGKCEVAKGATGAPRVTLALSFPDFLRLVSGKLNGMQAFFAGKLKLTGDMMFAQTMQGWFNAS